MKTVGTIPLVCTPTINNIAVTKTLIDEGAGLNVLSMETFEKLQLPYERLKPTRPFSGVTEGTTLPYNASFRTEALGQITLSVTFRTRENYRTEEVIFNIAHIALPYNAILGYPALAKFMVVTHHAYNTVKLPGYSGTITIRCVEKDALRSLEDAYKVTAATYPADEDAAEPPEAPPLKKKPQSSGTRTKGKEKLPASAPPEADMASIAEYTLPQ